MELGVRVEVKVEGVDLRMVVETVVWVRWVE